MKFTSSLLAIPTRVWHSIKNGSTTAGKIFATSTPFLAIKAFVPRSIPVNILGTMTLMGAIVLAAWILRQRRLKNPIKWRDVIIGKCNGSLLLRGAVCGWIFYCCVLIVEFHELKKDSQEYAYNYEQYLFCATGAHLFSLENRDIEELDEAFLNKAGIPAEYLPMIKGYYCMGKGDHEKAMAFLANDEDRKDFGDFLYGYMLFSGSEQGVRQNNGLNFIKEAAEKENLFAQYFMFIHESLHNNEKEKIKWAEKICNLKITGDRTPTLKFSNYNHKDAITAVHNKYMHLFYLTRLNAFGVLLQYYCDNNLYENALNLIESFQHNRLFNSLYSLLQEEKANVYLSQGNEKKASDILQRLPYPCKTLELLTLGIHSQNDTLDVEKLSLADIQKAEKIGLRSIASRNNVAGDSILEELYRQCGYMERSIVIDHLESYHKLYNEIPDSSSHIIKSVPLIVK